MAILGLLDTDGIINDRFKSVRRRVFIAYPNGKAPLTGILSLLEDEECSDPEFLFYEDRLNDQRSLTVANSVTPFGPFVTTSNTTQATAFTGTAQTTTIRISVDDSTKFRVNAQVKLQPLALTAGGPVEMFGRVTASSATAGPGSTPAIDVIFDVTQTLIANGPGAAGNVGIEVWIVGNAYAQGSLAIGSSPYFTAVNPTNYCQTFRTPFLITGTALKTPVKYDKTGPQANRAKQASVFHMIDIEKAFLFGQKIKTTGLATALGTQPLYMTGGIIYWMQQWEAGTFYGNSAATLDTDDNKRIISNTTGIMTERLYDAYMERLFRQTNNVANEKLCLCGSGFLSVINQLYKSRTTLMSDLPLADTFGMDVVKHRTSYGTVYYKTHPLFSQNPTWRYNALFLDINNLVYRPMGDRDTELLTHREPNDADYRMDEWLTEAGLEMRFPESHMLMRNVVNFA
jgi:hypothetical protein